MSEPPLRARRRLWTASHIAIRAVLSLKEALAGRVGHFVI